VVSQAASHSGRQSSPQTSRTASRTVAKDQGAGIEPLAHEIENGLEHPGQHLAADLVVLVPPEEDLHLRLLAEQAVIDHRRQVLAELARPLQAGDDLRLVRVGGAGHPGLRR